MLWWHMYKWHPCAHHKDEIVLICHRWQQTFGRGWGNGGGCRCPEASLPFANSRTYIHHRLFITVSASGLSFIIIILKFIYLFWERQREQEQGSGRERGGERESQAGSMLAVQSLMQGSIPQTVRSWPEWKLRVGHLSDLSHPGTPHLLFFITLFYW